MEADENHLELVEKLFLQMGSSEEQAKTMASQLLKRAKQISEERNITVVEAVDGLLKQIVDARKS